MNISPIYTKIWNEVPEDDNPFATKQAYCHGYQIHELSEICTYAEMIYLLFKGELPKWYIRLAFNKLSVIIANPGPRDPSVYAAMNGGVGGSPIASSLIAAIAAGAGQAGGAHEVALIMQRMIDSNGNLDVWKQYQYPTIDDTWPILDTVPGFDPNGAGTKTPQHVIDTLDDLEIYFHFTDFSHLMWIRKNKQELEEFHGSPINIAMVSAACFVDAGFTPEQGEALYLLLRLPGAAVHALEQWTYGFKKFPFPKVNLLDDPTKDVL